MPFLAVTESLRLVSIIYGITTFSPPTVITALEDKAISFCGNSTATQYPTAVLLQQ